MLHLKASLAGLFDERDDEFEAITLLSDKVLSTTGYRCKNCFVYRIKV